MISHAIHYLFFLKSDVDLLVGTGGLGNGAPPDSGGKSESNWINVVVGLLRDLLKIRTKQEGALFCQQRGFGKDEMRVLFCGMMRGRGGFEGVGRGCVWWDDCTGMNESLIRVVMWLQPVCGRDSRACISLIGDQCNHGEKLTHGS